MWIMREYVDLCSKNASRRVKFIPHLTYVVLIEAILRDYMWFNFENGELKRFSIYKSKNIFNSKDNEIHKENQFIASHPDRYVVQNNDKC